MTELTDKQLKALAEWMGRTGTIDRMDNPMWREQFTRYLLGNDGQAALMDKLGDMGGIYWDTGGPGVTGVNQWDVDISNCPPHGETRQGSAETRQEAIINAILDMLGAKNT